MEIKIKNYQEPKFLQEGGTVDQTGATAEPVQTQEPPTQGGDPMQQLLEGAAAAVQNQDCNTAMQVCQMFLQLAQGGAPAEQTPPAEPVYRKGGVLVRRITRK